jgi:hypothetical protein
MKQYFIVSIILAIFSIQGLFAESITKINEQYGDLGLYETYMMQGKHEKCKIVILHGSKIVDTSCLRITNSKKQKILCTKRKSICKTYRELFYFSEKGYLPKIKKISKKTKLNLPFIGKKQTKNGRTKITISKNGKMTIISYFKNGYKAYFNGKYTKDLIPEQSEIPMHGWKLYKSKVCQGYRNAWECEKLY